MNIQLTLRILGALLLFLSAALLFPIPFALYFYDGAATTFLWSAGITFLSGLILFQLCRSYRDLSVIATAVEPTREDRLRKALEGHVASEGPEAPATS